MRILGIDPGQTSGWCLYDADDKLVISAGHFERHKVSPEMLDAHTLSTEVVVESFTEVRAGIYPATVAAAYYCGRIVEFMSIYGAVHETSRLAVKKALTAATHGEINVKNDATAWAALVLLHGEGSDRKPRRKKGVVVDAGGPLGEVKGHARAALATAYAWWTMRPAP